MFRLRKEVLSADEYNKIIGLVVVAYQQVLVDLTKEGYGKDEWPPILGLLIFGSMGAGIEDINPPHIGCDVDVQPVVGGNEWEVEYWAGRVVDGLVDLLNQDPEIHGSGAGIWLGDRSINQEMELVKMEGRHRAITLICRNDGMVVSGVEMAARENGVGVRTILC